MNKKEIKSFEDLFIASVDPDEFISTFISGHLMVEFMLEKIILAKNPLLTKLVNDLNHYRLIELAFGLELICDKKKEVFIEINKLRNKIAHNVNYRPSISNLRILFKKIDENFYEDSYRSERISEELGSKTSLDKIDPHYFSDLFILISNNLYETYLQNGGSEKRFPLI